jgi:hypothetical protein
MEKKKSVEIKALNIKEATSCDAAAQISHLIPSCLSSRMEK